MLPGICWRILQAECSILFPANRNGILVSDHFPIEGSCRIDPVTTDGIPEFLKSPPDGFLSNVPIAISDESLDNIASVFRDSGSPVVVPDPIGAFNFPVAVRIKYQVIQGHVDPVLHLRAYNEAGQLLGAELTNLMSGEALQLVYPTFDTGGGIVVYDFAGLVIYGEGIDRIYNIEVEVPALAGEPVGSMIILGDNEMLYDFTVSGGGSGIKGISEHICYNIPISVHLEITPTEVT